MQTTRELRLRWHWQNLNEGGSGFREGRCWWHFGQKSITFNWNLWTHFCEIGVDWDDEDTTLMLAFPPVAFWLSFSSNWAILKRLLPHKPLTYYPDTIVIDEREVGIRIHGGCLWIHPYSKKNEWAKVDPWWVRGVTVHLNPFEWHFMRHETRAANGTWEIEPPARLGVPQWETHPEVFTYPYTYLLKTGEVQKRIATVQVERRAWRPKCLRWTGLIEKVITCIDVRFDDEVGDRSGSWKGGCIGCGYELNPGESVETCLRRMEQTIRMPERSGRLLPSKPIRQIGFYKGQ